MELSALETAEIVQPPEADMRKPWTAPILIVSSVEDVTLTGGYANTDSGINMS